MINCVLAVTDDFSHMKEIRDEGGKRDVQVQYVSSFNEAIELMEIKDFSLVSIRIDGFEYIEKLRIIRSLKPMPIILFSYGCISDNEKVEALKAGADVFINTPYSMDYIIESGLALVRLYTKLGGSKRLDPGSILMFDHIILSTQSYSVYIHGEEVALSHREFTLLKIFMREPGRVFTYEQLFQLVVGYDEVDNIQKVIYNHTYQLRRKLKISPETPNYIVSIKDVGYKFIRCNN